MYFAVKKETFQTNVFSTESKTECGLYEVIARIVVPEGRFLSSRGEVCPRFQLGP
jgi:hypothetical protein